MADKSPYTKLLKFVGFFLPGDYLKTLFYLNIIYKPRKFIRLGLESFYRIDHIYEVLEQAKKNYKGNFSILEFGVSHGYTFVKMLYATRYLGLESRVIVHGFDSFEGLPYSENPADKDMCAMVGWVEGQFKSEYDKLDSYCRSKYGNYKLHRGYFNETITEEFLESLKVDIPVLVWIDCDYYSSTKDVFDRILNYLPNGCVIYFDDYDFNYRSRFTGEARFVYEINRGDFGDGVELVLDEGLSLNSKRIYRFINANCPSVYTRCEKFKKLTDMRPILNDSPMP